MSDFYSKSLIFVVSGQVRKSNPYKLNSYYFNIKNRSVWAISSFITLYLKDNFKSFGRKPQGDITDFDG